MLHECIEQSDADRWEAPVDRLCFCQAVFHTLFFTDVYLGDDLESFKTQRFHQENATYFADYEELADRRQKNRYDRVLTRAYLEHCRGKAQQVLASETEDSLAAESQLSGMSLIRAELHIYNIRHIHHHAAQLSLHLKQTGGRGVRWVGSGWTDLD